MNKNTNDLSQLKPGDVVWVLERDENDQLSDFSGYMFLAKVNDYIIATPWINDIIDADEMLGYLAEDFAECHGTDLSIFPANVCFKAKEEAQAALSEATD